MRKKALILIALILAFANSGAILAAPLVGATAPQIKFCHATNSVTNPYNMIETDANSIIQQGHGGHDGDWPHPVVSYLDEAQYYKDHHIDWGDIIPPFNYQTVKWGMTFNHHFDGLNYTEEGQGMIASNCQYVYTVPTEATFTDATCVKNFGTYTIPDIKGLTYYVNGHKKNDGTYKVSANIKITITVKADRGYTIDPTATTSWTHNFVMKTKADCTVTPLTVTFTDIYCDADGSYTVPAVEGVKYYNDEELLIAGTPYIVSEDSEVTITAKVDAGYFLAEGAQTVWEWSFTVPSEESCQLGVTDITPAEVKFVQPTCSALGSYTIPTTEGINYMIGEKVVAAGVYSADNGTTVKVVAVPSDEKNTIKEGAQTEWTNTFTAPTGCGSVLGETTVKTLPNTSGTGMNPIAYLAAFSIAFMALAGAAMKRFYTERL